jgi:hypothetical protein
LSPKPIVDYGYVESGGNKLFAISVLKSDELISVDGKIYKRENNKTVLSNPTVEVFSVGGYSRIFNINKSLGLLKNDSTNSKNQLLEHYQSILKIIDSLKILLYPEQTDKPTTNKEGRVLSRILFSSVVDNFETYLSDILFEIYLAKPETLKSEQMVKVEDVLNCSDIQEFIVYWATQKIGKLQKGSVNGFIKENKQIRELNIITPNIQKEVEKILQIRHLYSHRNGIVDEKFIKYFTTGYIMGTEHQMSIDDILDKQEYLTDLVNKIDNAAKNKYSLSAL